MSLHVAQVVLHFPVRNRIGPETYGDNRPNQLWRQPFSVACDFMLSFWRRSGPVLVSSRLCGTLITVYASHSSSEHS